MRKKWMVIPLALTVMLSSISFVSGSTKGITYDTIKMNDRVYYQYEKKSNILLDADVDRIQTLLNKMGEAFNARVDLDEVSKTINIIKPNVQLITAGMIGTDKDNNIIFERVFGKIKRGQKVDKFKVYAEIQNIPAGNVDFRLQIKGLDQNDLDSKAFVVSPDSASTDKSDVTIIFDVNSSNITESFVIQLQMKLEGESKYYTIAEKLIEVTD